LPCSGGGGGHVVVGRFVSGIFSVPVRCFSRFAVCGIISRITIGSIVGRFIGRLPNAGLRIDFACRGALCGYQCRRPKGKKIRSDREDCRQRAARIARVSSGIDQQAHADPGQQGDQDCQPHLVPTREFGDGDAHCGADKTADHCPNEGLTELHGRNLPPVNAPQRRRIPRR
jgi:hypothetical protein